MLALLALSGTILISAAGSIFARTTSGGPEEAVAGVLQQTRRESVLRGREVTLRFDDEAQRFLWDGSSGPKFASGRPGLKIDFLRPTAGSAVLIGGRLVDTTKVAALRFFPDGSCDPVRVQLRTPGVAARVLEVDPWTCAPGLEAKR